MTCAPSNCFGQSTSSNCTCVKKLDADCITPPCRAWGECAQKVAQRGGRDVCMPDTGSEGLSANCAKVVIAFHILLLPKGTYLESICEEFRYLTLSQQHHGDEDEDASSSGVTLRCSRTKIRGTGVNLLNVSVHTTRRVAPHVALQLAKNFNAMSSRDVVGDARKHRMLSGDVLYKLSGAVVNVTVERYTHTSQLSQDQDGHAFMVPLASGTASLAFVLLLILLLYAYKRRQKAEQLAPETFFTKKKNQLFVEKCGYEKNTNRERNISKADPYCELLDPNMYIDCSPPSCKKFMVPMMLGGSGAGDDNIAV